MNTISGQKVRVHGSCFPLGQNSSVPPPPYPRSILGNTFSNTDFILVFLSQRGLCGILRSVMGELLERCEIEEFAERKGGVLVPGKEQR